MKLTPEVADEFGRQLGIAVKAAVRKATEGLEIRILSLEARLNAVEAGVADEPKKGKKR